MSDCRIDGCVKQTVGHHTICSMHRGRKQRTGSYELQRPRGYSRHPLYPRWKLMLQRCEKPYNEAYAYYGGRGIKVCDRWHDFTAFAEDVGLPPSNQHTLDRIDNNGNYEPSNIRWALRDVQVHNQRARTECGFKGVYRFGSKYRASIDRNGKRYYLGTFDTPESAYKAYLQKEAEIYGN